MKKIVHARSLLLAFVLISCTQKPAEESKIEAVKPTLKNEIVGVAEIQPQLKVIALYPQVGGIIKTIYHDINDHVNKGDVIAELVSDIESAQLAQAESKLITQQAVIQSSKSQLASVTVKLENAKVNYSRNQNLIRSGGITQQAFDDSKFSSESSARDVEAAAAVVKQQESRLIEMRADLNYYQQLINQKSIRAPYDGKMLSMEGKIGNFISTSQSVGDFAPDGKLMAIMEVDELYANNVSSGLSAYIRPQGKTDTLATGKIFLTSPYLRKKSLFSNNASNMEDRRVREVRVLLDESSHVLIGSRVEGVIQLLK